MKIECKGHLYPLFGSICDMDWCPVIADCDQCVIGRLKDNDVTVDYDGRVIDIVEDESFSLFLMKYHKSDGKQ